MSSLIRKTEESAENAVPVRTHAPVNQQKGEKNRGGAGVKLFRADGASASMVPLIFIIEKDGKISYRTVLTPISMIKEIHATDKFSSPLYRGYSLRGQKVIVDIAATAVVHQFPHMIIPLHNIIADFKPYGWIPRPSEPSNIGSAEHNADSSDLNEDDGDVDEENILYTGNIDD